MDKSHRDLLKLNRVALCEDLDWKRATTFLYSKSILSENDKDDIDAAKTPGAKCEKLLDILPKRGPNAFQALLECLDGKQDHLFKLLQPVEEELGADQGDGNKSSRFKLSSSSQRDGVDPRDMYPMSNSPKGRAFIINNKIFKPSSSMDKYPRNGTDVDAEALKRLFTDLGFETKVYHNQGTKDMLEIADFYSSVDYSSYDCFMCAILTHGEEGVIYSTDGKVDLKELTSKFRTRVLLGKPKLFFFQACQGLVYMDGADQPDGQVENAMDEVDARENNKITTIPIEADFLYAYSTVPGYFSWRNSTCGTWFVQAIVSVFRKHAHNMDVMRMLTRVSAEVALQKSNTNEDSSDNKKQIPSIVSQLRKDLFFFPEDVVGQK